VTAKVNAGWVYSLAPRIDSLEHGADLEDETIAEMVSRNTYYAPLGDKGRPDRRRQD
jgi:hypothetical protein